ncbi:rod shape-determining protein MreD [Sphingobacterium faecale]|uniref:Rod shape-determining protein MreD n=1 Tax=Sphingobacterium faecale TaxID=2803775 RepID=A0ABS1R262_9SPHI|nr:rod shape-determining protein MreD [Sphingobacterium faecale]MBL1408792.1 rod shape-determining protein MreD [Sphingobacterium faecale]
MARVFIFNIVRFLILIILQIAVFKNIGYYNIATLFPYILIILLLPTGIPNFFLFLLALLTGLTVDAFYDSIGVHAAACVALAWFRIFFHKITLDVEEQAFQTPSWGNMGFKWFSTYLLLGTLVHHLVLFLTEVFSFQNILHTLASIFFSSLFTVVVILLISLITYNRKSRLAN